MYLSISTLGKDKKKEKTDDTEVLSQKTKDKSARGQEKRNQEGKWFPVKLLIREVNPQAQFPVTVSGIIYSLLL